MAASASDYERLRSLQAELEEAVAERERLEGGMARGRGKS